MGGGLEGMVWLLENVRYLMKRIGTLFLAVLLFGLPVHVSAATAQSAALDDSLIQNAFGARPSDLNSLNLGSVQGSEDSGTIILARRGGHRGGHHGFRGHRGFSGHHFGRHRHFGHRHFGSRSHFSFGFGFPFYGGYYYRPYYPYYNYSSYCTLYSPYYGYYRAPYSYCY